HAAMLEQAQQRDRHATAELAEHRDSDRRLVEEENAQLKERAAELAASVADFNRLRDLLNQQLNQRNDEVEQLKAELAATAHADHQQAQLREQYAALEARYERVSKEQQATADNILELERALRLAEDARERHEQQRAQLE